MQSLHTTARVRFEQLEQRRMLCADLEVSHLLAEESGDVHAADEGAVVVSGLAGDAAANRDVPFHDTLEVGGTGRFAAANVFSSFARDSKGAKVVWGEQTIVDGARMVTWAIVSAQDDQVLAAGATMSLKFFDNQPLTAGPGPAGAWATLDFPQVVKDQTYFNHFELQSSPHGHPTGPGSVNPDRNRVPHFDFHFYGIPEEQVWQIPAQTPPLPPVPPNRLPAGYTQPGPSEPQMGRHSAPIWSLSDPAPLSTIMIAGFTPDASQMHFIEPMVSREVLMSRQDFTLPVPMPQTFDRDTLYPTSFEGIFHGGAYHFVFRDFIDTDPQTPAVAVAARPNQGVTAPAIFSREPIPAESGWRGDGRTAWDSESSDHPDTMPAIASSRFGPPDRVRKAY